MVKSSRYLNDFHNIQFVCCQLYVRSPFDSYFYDLIILHSTKMSSENINLIPKKHPYSLVADYGFTNTRILAGDSYMETSFN